MTSFSGVRCCCWFPFPNKTINNDNGRRRHLGSSVVVAATPAPPPPAPTSCCESCPRTSPPPLPKHTMTQSSAASLPCLSTATRPSPPPASGQPVRRRRPPHRTLGIMVRDAARHPAPGRGRSRPPAQRATRWMSHSRAPLPRHRLGLASALSVEEPRRPLLADALRSPPTHSAAGGGSLPELAMSASASCILLTFPLQLAHCCCRKLGLLPPALTVCGRSTISPSLAPLTGCCSSAACAYPCHLRLATAAAVGCSTRSATTAPHVPPPASLPAELSRSSTLPPEFAARLERRSRGSCASLA